MKRAKTINSILANENLEFYNGKVIAPRLRTSYFDLNRANQNLLKQQIRAQILADKQLVQKLHDHGIEVDQILLVKRQPTSGPVRQIQVDVVEKTRAQLDEEQTQLTERMSYVKDTSYLSNEQYRLFREQLFFNFKLPTLYSVLKERHDLEDKLPKIYENAHGFFFDAAEKIKFILGLKLKHSSDVFKDKDTIKINFRGDGTLVGNSGKFLNFCFNLPDEGTLAKTAFGQYTLGIFHLQKENHETLSSAYHDIVAKLKTLKGTLKKIYLLKLLSYIIKVCN